MKTKNLVTKKYLSYLKLMRFNHPIGIFLLLWPCLISLGYAYKVNLNFTITLIFIVGSILMRSAGCIINDLVDQDIDRQVERTKNRPLANSELTRKEAIKLLLVILLLAASLFLFLNKLAIYLSLFAFLLVVIYPFCKKITFWPQLFLGLTFNMGSLIAWAQVKEQINKPAIILYIAFIFWTLGYDTIYAHQDIEDDLRIGVKSTAIKFGEKTTRYVNWFYTCTISLLLFMGALMAKSFNYYFYLTPVVILLFWQVSTLDIKNPQNCLRRFKANFFVGLFLFIATILR